MITRIVFPSALEYWLQEKGIPYRYWDTLKTANPDDKKTGRASITETVKQLNFSTPVHVAVPKGTCRNKTEIITYHVIPKGLPENSFIHITNDIFISSPEMCFLQAALVLSLPQLVKLAGELCAIFVSDPYEEYGQRNREQITSVSNIRDYLKQSKGLKGSDRALQAIQYAFDRANSPMEVNLATLAALPIYHGGFGLGHFSLNYDVALSDKGSKHLGRNICCCDFVWPKQKVVLEYDSNLSHLSRQQHAKDKARITALSLSGYKVISITADDIRNFEKTEALFSMLRHTLGERANAAALKKQAKKRRKVVHAIMFSNNNK